MTASRLVRLLLVSSLASVGAALPAPSTAQNATGTSGAEADAATTPTYYGAVESALRRNCAACHQPDAPNLGGITAPMSLVTYQDARRWSARVAEVLRDGYMPPWGADRQHEGVFRGERYISEEDRGMLIAWAEGGAPMGDPSDAATDGVTVADAMGEGPVTGPDGNTWWMGVPDMIVGFQEPILVCDAVEDWQPRVPMHVQHGELSEPRWIRAMEISPGSDIVHHTVSSHLGVGVPGRGPFEFPEGWALLLTENPYVSISMHYHKEPGPGTAVLDDTKGGFKFYDDGAVIDHLVETDIQMFTDFTIPAGHPNYEVRNQTHFDEDVYLLSMGPHAHYRGKAVKIELERPDRPFRETLLWVPDYDFNWQFQYELREPYLIPAGSTMHITWWYDNSADNPFNPDPTVDVTYGPATTDEMMNARIYYARAEPLGLVAGGEIPEDILTRSRAQEEQARERAQAWEMQSESCPTAPGVASR